MGNFAEETVLFSSKYIMLLTSEFIRYWVVTIYMALNLEPPLLYSTMNFV
jgi:hypothetical protein